MKSRRGDKSLIRAINRNLVLNLLHMTGELSRSEIARQSGLGNATISEISSELIGSGLLEEIGEGESTGGRRPLLLRLNPHAGYVVGIKVMEQSLTCAVTDLRANVVAHSLHPLGNDHHPKTIQALLIKAVHATIRASKVAPERVLGIGIGLAGLIDGHGGKVLYSPYFDWRNVDFAGEIAEHFSLPVYLENDVNTLTIAQQWFGHGRGVDSFAVITVGRGIGSGIVMNGQFCRDAAGEIGHVTLLLNGPRCDCGKRGCLEAIAADPAVIRHVTENLAVKPESSLHNTQQITMEAIIQAAKSGDGLAIQALEKSGYFLGMGIALLINLLSPQRVIVSGEGLQAGSFRLEPMHRAIKENVFNGLGERTQIFTEFVEDETWARGAASLVLGEIFKSPVHGESTIIERLL
jgi:predicted NBD/HSP70 family sugar kinase